MITGNANYKQYIVLILICLHFWQQFNSKNLALSLDDFTGYLNNVEETMSTVDKGGWLHTGDIVYVDQYGYVHIIDRLKEVIKYKGFQV